MTDKPSRNEDEYFAREEREKIARQREEARRQTTVEERRSHFMRCPKCGGNLLTETFHGVPIDRCTDCHGIWLDADEIDAVVAHEDNWLQRRVYEDCDSSLRSQK
jgi:Zn-finger nucleic acid-binding protein